MGKINSMTASIKRHRTAVPAILALALALPAAGQAQDGSPGGFSLPPGEPPAQQPPSDVQGPVDSESTPPRRTDQPVEPAPTPRPVVPTIAPVPVPVPQQREEQPPRQRARPAPQRDERQTPTPAQQQPQSEAQPVPTPQDPAVDATPAFPAAPLPLPSPDISAPSAPAPDAEAADEAADGSVWWWLAAGLVALLSLIVMALRQRSAARARSSVAAAPVASTATVPTPPLRTPPPAPQAAPAPPPPTPTPPPARQPSPAAPFGTIQSSGLTFGAAAPSPAPAPSAPAPVPPAPVPQPAPQPPAAPPAAADAGVQVPRLLLDFTTLGVDVTLVNAIARYHLGITNMSEITVSDVALHGAVVQARRGMPPTIDPMRGDSLLPLLQQVADISPDGTQRCEGQIRLPLEQIEPIEMQGRLLFVPVVHIWIGYSGPDGTRYAVTQSFVLGEESSPPGPRVGPLRLDLGPRRFTEVGQRPLQPA